MPTGLGVIQQLSTPSAIVCGTHLMEEHGAGANVAAPLLSTATDPAVAIETPCKYVWIGAPANNDGVATNTKPFQIGDATNQYIVIANDDFEGINIAIDDASKIYVVSKADDTNDVVNYAIFS